MFKKNLLTFLFFLITIVTTAQSVNEPSIELEKTELNYVVLAVVLTIFAGILFFLFVLENRLSKIEKENKD